MSEKFNPAPADILIIDLARKTIESEVDCALLWDEAETLHDDYPEYKLIIFKLPYEP